MFLSINVYCQTDVFISALPAVSTIDGTYLFITESPTTTYKMTLTQFRNLVLDTAYVRRYTNQYIYGKKRFMDSVSFRKNVFAYGLFDLSDASSFVLPTTLGSGEGALSYSTAKDKPLFKNIGGDTDTLITSLAADRIRGKKTFWITSLIDAQGAVKLTGRDTAKTDYIYSKTVGGNRHLYWRRNDTTAVPLDSAIVGTADTSLAYTWTGLHQWTQDSIKIGGLWYDYPATRIANSVLYDSLGSGILKWKTFISADSAIYATRYYTGQTYKAKSDSTALTGYATNYDLTLKQNTLTTGNLTESITGLEFDATRQVIGGSATLSLTSGYVIPTTTEQANWNTAYGWGNHASAGYTTLATVVGANNSWTGTNSFIGDVGVYKGISVGILNNTDGAIRLNSSSAYYGDLTTTPSTSANRTWTLPDATGTMALGTGAANQIAYWSATNTLATLTTATYPSLTELYYVKGVTSSIQTQLNAKGSGTVTSVATSSPITGGTITTTGTIGFDFSTANTWSGINKFQGDTLIVGKQNDHLSILRFYNGTNPKYVDLVTPAPSANATITLPSTTGTLLLTNGSGASLTGTASSLTAGAVTNGVYTNANNSLTGNNTHSGAIILSNAVVETPTYTGENINIGGRNTVILYFGDPYEVNLTGMSDGQLIFLSSDKDSPATGTINSVINGASTTLSLPAGRSVMMRYRSSESTWYATGQ